MRRNQEMQWLEETDLKRNLIKKGLFNLARSKHYEAKLKKLANEK